ncbi:bifunctional metallophosphatase/5'-nucleotidase [Sphingomonas sp.]|jgi:5'-nucleotidase|uniref:bifunctional metallophosphatase/5'-nucleotidase n=1 Tax=Sphingomonas sp. TaxID=28214 RepID=UPI002D80FD06|nr:bifunctional metallophosphatase/5'-nucleotidase [Sphingomonas sp.]HEU0044132.1 bifunctional metallophosphatase/5'-nucleotidase [Sphingomonas sp.]
MRRLSFLLTLAALGGCATPRLGERPAAPIAVKIIALNDFHGALEPPGQSVPVTGPSGETVNVPAGGAAHLASAVARLKARNPNNLVVAAGDLTSASPFVSSQFLDEPSILALNLIGLDLNAVGNHEFDRGPDELKRLQGGGCAKHTARVPCRVDPTFPGASFRYLAANVRTADGRTLFPATAIRTVGMGKRTARIGFIGLTLRTTPSLVVPTAVATLTFDDEAKTINALVPKLKAQGADAVVVLIHQGLYTKVGYNDKSCGGVSGDLLPILAQLDPAVDLVVSGHTHRAYVCDYGAIDPTRPILVTSAGRNGTLLTDIELLVDPVAHRVTAKRADNLVVQGAAYASAAGPVPLRPEYPVFPAEPRVAALVKRYVAAASPVAARIVGRMSGPATRQRTASGESVAGNLVADMQRQATGADLAFMNGEGLRADLIPAADASVTYGQLYAVMPFGNVLQVKGMTGRQIRAVLEQQFDSASNTVARPNMMMVSRDVTYRYDLRRPAGQRILDLRLDGRPIDDARTYRVGVSNFLAAGGDNFTVFTQGTDLAGGPEDIDAFETYVRAAGTLTPPATDRITRLDTPAG